MSKGYGIHICSPGALKIKGTASGIYPIPPGYQGLLPGGYIYPPGSGGLTSWGIYISPRKSAYHFLGIYIYRPGNAGKKGGETTPIPPRTVKKRTGRRLHNEVKPNLKSV